MSIRAINAEAGLGAASAHYHFGSKDAILDAVLIDAGADVLAHIHALTTAMVDSGQRRMPSRSSTSSQSHTGSTSEKIPTRACGG